MTDEDLPTDADLALRAQSGNRRAFDELVLRHKDPIYRFVRRYVGSDADAYDVLQDTFISAWLALPRYQREKSFPTWLRTIALNKCRDFGRSQRVRRRFRQMLWFYEPNASVAAAPDVGESVELDRLNRLDKAIADLPPFYKEPLLLVTVSGLSQQEAAAQLKTTTKAIEMRIRRAKRKLSEILSDSKERDDQGSPVSKG